jgi:hypothetical protein
MTDWSGLVDQPDKRPRIWQDPEREKRNARLREYLAGIVDLDTASWNSTPLPGGLWDAPAFKVPRVVWLYWHQGWDDAPEVAQVCLESWRAFNPGYEIRPIDHAWVKATYGEQLRFQPKIGVVGFSDRLRMKLLSEHGGIWADATIFCSQPLDAWIHILLTPSRLFAFADPSPERIVATWFLAAMPRSPLLEAWDDVLRTYLMNLEREDRTMHAYFFTHYALEFIIDSSLTMHAWWDAMPKVAIATSVALSRFAKLASKEPPPRAFGEDDHARIREILTLSPIHRLTRKGAVAAGFPNARVVIDILADYVARATG